MTESTESNPQLKGKWLINHIIENNIDLQTTPLVYSKIWTMTNEEFDKIMEKYEENEDDISPCPKCGCETVIIKNDNYVCEKCKEIII